MKRLRKLLFILLFSFIAIFAIVSVYLYLNQDKLIQQIIGELNKELNVKVELNQIQLNWYQDFPNISITATDLKMGESFKNSKSSLAELKSISLSFDLIPLMRGQYVVDRLKLSSGSVHIGINELGEKNYILMKPKQQEEASPKDVSFQLREIIINNVLIDYHDKKLEQHYVLMGDQAKASLMKDGQKFDISLNGQFESRYLSIHEMNYFEDKSLSINAILAFYQNDQLVNIQPSTVKVNNNEFKVLGEFNIDTDQIELDVEGVQADIKTIGSLLPNEYEDYILAYKASGEATFKAKVSGEISSKADPLVNINFSLKNTLLIDPTYNTQIDSLSLSGSFSNGYNHSLRSSVLDIKNLSASLNRKRIAGSFVLRNFIKPHLQLQSEGAISTYDLFSFFPNKESFSTLTGNIDFNIKLAGNVEDFKNASTAHRINNSGEINLRNVGGIYQEYPLPLSGISGKLLFNKNDIAVNSLQGKIGESDVEMNGFFLNIFPYLLTDDQSILIEAATRSKFIDLNELLSGLSNKNSSQEKQQASYSLSLSPKIQLDLKSSIDKLIFQRFDGRKIKGVIEVRDEQLRARQLTMHTMGGDIQLVGSIDTSPADIIDIHTNATFNKLNIDSVFYTFYDFNQDFLTQRHIKGLINADVLAHIELTKSLNFIPESFEASIAATINNGELNDFEPMQSLSRYVNEKDLANLSFGELSNSIQIKNKTIYLPEMLIKSNISEIKIQGTHTFDQKIDYKLLVPLKNYKKKDKDKAFGAIEESDDYTKLHLKITGTTDDFNVSWDAKRTLNAVGEKLKEEVKNIFKGEPDKKKKQLEVEEDEYFDW